MAIRRVDVRNVLYHFLQRDLHDTDPELFRLLTARLVARLGIWLSPQTYEHLPLLVPFARRDSHARGNRAAGMPDQWGSPDQAGYFRDDNSLVKGLPRSLPIASSFPLYRGARLGNGFVASHVWRKMNTDEGAARNPLTYSFVPNLVWLPAQVAGLTDLEGSFVQRFLQRISIAIFRESAVAPAHQALVGEIWDLLPEPAGSSELPLPDVESLSFFGDEAKFRTRRVATIQAVAAALASGAPEGKIVSTRYSLGIPRIPRAARQELGEFLERYAHAAASSG